MGIIKSVSSPQKLVWLCWSAHSGCSAGKGRPFFLLTFRWYATENLEVFNFSWYATENINGSFTVHFCIIVCFLRRNTFFKNLSCKHKHSQIPCKLLPSPLTAKKFYKGSSPSKGSPVAVLPLQREPCSSPPPSKGALQLSVSSPFKRSPATVLFFQREPCNIGRSSLEGTLKRWHACASLWRREPCSCPPPPKGALQQC